MAKVIHKLIDLFRSSDWAFDFDTVVLRFKKLKIKSVLLIAYDVYDQGMVPGVVDVRIILLLY